MIIIVAIESPASLSVNHFLLLFAVVKILIKMKKIKGGTMCGNGDIKSVKSGFREVI